MSPSTTIQPTSVTPLETKSFAPNWQETDEFHLAVLRATRTCIQYGTCGFAVVCIVIGAIESFFGR